MNTQEVQTFIIFVVIAVARTLLDIAFWQYLVWIFKDNNPLVKLSLKYNLNKYALAQVISFLVASVISYYSNKFITFKDNAADSLSLIGKFLAISVFALVLSVWLIEFLTSNKKILKLVQRYPLINRFWPLLCKLITIFVTLVINYFGQRYWVFIN
jgi:putative flippase GtrA